ncbi:MAG TPA: TrkA family potassium uptake protein [Mobilitalea sp.]|nr:TrkA family potassium uptake protein [Mobilitalea sp.]
MKLIVIGGGRIGYNLVKALNKKGFHTTLVESNKTVCEDIAEAMSIDIIWGDGTDYNVLKDAGVDKAETVIAVTGSDDVNFMVCQIAKTYFNVRNTIARVDNPSNAVLYKALGVDQTISVTEDILNLIMK